MGYELQNVTRVSSLDGDNIPNSPGVHRLLVDLVEDAMGLPIAVPVLVIRAKKPGPVLGLTSAIHGNEINGIPVIWGLMRRLPEALARGTVIAALPVNVPGFHLHQREYSDGSDLNDIMPGKVHGSAAEVYVARVVDRIVRPLDFLVDLHTASAGRHNTLYVRADLANETTARMATLLRPQIVLHNAAEDGTLRAQADDMGIPAVTLEIGNPHRFQPEYIRSSLAGIRRVLSWLGMVRKGLANDGPRPVFCSRSLWMYSDRGGLLDVLPALASDVAKGEIVARLRDIFGTTCAEYAAPTNGIVIGRSVNPVGPTGARILHLGVRAQPGDPALPALASWLTER